MVSLAISALALLGFDKRFVSYSQQTLECIAKEDEIQYLVFFDASNQSLSLLVCSKVSGESINHLTFD